MLNRRRFLSISAAALGVAPIARAGEAPVYLWSGIALGARATIRLSHPDAAAITERIAAEIDRLEDVFSLYRTDSSLMRLNVAGRLDLPSPELLECLTLAGAVHQATGGLFDPTVQPLWSIWAKRAAAGARPSTAELATLRARGGWPDLRLSASAISLPSGGALTLNGIAQGYIADRVAALLAAEGLTDILIDTGEHHALGGHPDGGDWLVRLAEGGQVGLRSRALATSAPLGTVFDAAGAKGHILHPATGEPAETRWRSVSISAPSAALADALSTAACLAGSRAEIDAFAGAFAGARCEAAVPV
ncbi:FAD:protein FMN transferase [Defluviimonas aestuarii]|uniref:FAD:protein FMN transferase n=1 Tax=Albidovulum aestuarii TaxID=1130726 RepID=UPI00249AE3F1|nr:FAD:protein FMN transferase [Defluviimonas aestuarii]MDI3338012.1 FAD:protein FMN transferase [Defluviimonas aestuarii]